MTPDDLIGRTFGRDGRYQVQSKLGAGGMGVVFRAVDTAYDRPVALKVLRREDSDDPERVTRFKREGRRCAALVHPNIVRIFGAGREEAMLYIASELIEGLNLYELLKKNGGPLPVDRALDVIRDAAKGLKEAHRMGIIHRDLKPENIMVRDADGVVKVLDFGIAKDLHDSVGRTKLGTVLGTVGYSAPEQVRGYGVDARSDIFSLGAVLYELVTGAVAFRGKTAEVNRQTKEDDPVPPEELNAAVPPAVSELIRTMMRKNPDRRPASCDDVIAHIDRIRTLPRPPAGP